jgi:hypothetical protein
MDLRTTIQMNIEHKEFIGIYRNLFPDGYCQHLIDEFHRLKDSGAGTNRQNGEGAPKHVKDDYQIFINAKSHTLLPFQNKEFDNGEPYNAEDLFFQGLQKCYDDYSNEYSVLKHNGSIRSTAMKMQLTLPGGGYHVWHCEAGSNKSLHRVIVYALYLNTIQEEGAETEFLYQKMRIKPEENMMLLWPAGYTHAHRGNPVLGEANKYIVTGWFYYD